MPVATASTALNDQNRVLNTHVEEEDIKDTRWYRPLSSSSPYRLSLDNDVIHQSSSATMGSWGFDVNRSTNGHLPSSFMSNNNYTDNDYRTNTRTSRRLDESTEDFNERLVNRSPLAQRSKLPMPTMTKQHDGNEFAAVNHLVLGPSRIVQSDYYPADDSLGQQYIVPTTRSRQSSTRSILRRRSKSIGDSTKLTTNASPHPPPSSLHPTQSYHQYPYHERNRPSPNTNHRRYTEHELIAWQNRMLERFVLREIVLIYYPFKLERRQKKEKVVII